jgi:hypothetical protein
MPARARIDRRAAVGIVLRDVRRAAALTAASNKIGSVIVFVAAHRAAGSGIVLDHVDGDRLPLRSNSAGFARRIRSPRTGSN